VDTVGFRTGTREEGKRHRTEVTEVREGSKLVGEEAWVDTVGFRAGIREEGKRHRTEVTEVTERGFMLTYAALPKAISTLSDLT
jgi:hypothetical protein